MKGKKIILLQYDTQLSFLQFQNARITNELNISKIRNKMKDRPWMFWTERNWKQHNLEKKYKQICIQFCQQIIPNLSFDQPIPFLN